MKFDLSTLLKNVNAVAAVPVVAVPASSVPEPVSAVPNAANLSNFGLPTSAATTTVSLEDGQVDDLNNISKQQAIVKEELNQIPPITTTKPNNGNDVKQEPASSVTFKQGLNESSTPSTPLATTPVIPASSFAKPQISRRNSPADISQLNPPPVSSPIPDAASLPRAPPVRGSSVNDFNADTPPRQQGQGQQQLLNQQPFPRIDHSVTNGGFNNNQKFLQRRPPPQLQQQQQQQQQPQQLQQQQQQHFSRDGFIRRPSAGPNAPPTGGKRSLEEAFPGLAVGVRNMKTNLIGQMKFDTVKAGQLTTAAISKLPNGGQPPNEGSSSNLFSFETSNKPKPLLFSPQIQPPEWKFKLNLPVDPLLPSEKTDPSFVTLTTVSILRRPGFPTFLLDSEYTLKSTLPRSYFNILHSHTVQHNFVFNFTNPEHSLFKEMAGLRKTGYFNIKEAASNEEWELHLKQSRERTNFFGYLIRASDLRNFIQQRMTMTVASRKLPLVLDLDDTLVRMIGNEEGRYVPPHLAQLGWCIQYFGLDSILTNLYSVPERVRSLTDGRRVVLTERVEEFLQWAQRYFEISVCSVGDQPYVDMVIAVLDPQTTTIRGQGSRARADYRHIQGTSMAKRPPKDLDSLFIFPQRSNGGGEGCPPAFSGPFVEPLVIDDNVGMWPVEQQDNIIVVREQRNSKVWNVQLFPHVQAVLQSVHSEFFKQLDNWDFKSASPANPGPSSRQIYKEYLRNELSRRIAEPSVVVGPAFPNVATGVVPGLTPSVVGGLAAASEMSGVQLPAVKQEQGGVGVVKSPGRGNLIGTFTLPTD
ncbi:UNVERIFIED_CONTAM: hypothetical protein HDU68_005371 [Siphonaria sp. JEL0065]|nr:hypothetical protein HDU68_005371 [Siphonaria sp. JEL0065]